MLSLSVLALMAAEPDSGIAKKMLPLYIREAESYSLAVESEPKNRLALKKEPIFEWLNPARDKGQQGNIFLWLRDGRPAALACIFSHPHDKLPGRKIVHELHALDSEKLLVKRDGLNQWKPESGLARKELAGAAAPATTAGTRLLQMRRLAQEFTGYSVDRDRKRWELRLLPTPLYRYPTAKKGVVDGALFAYMSSAGTDPEMLLLIEAREKDGKLNWEYACGRFSDWELHMLRKEKEVWSSVIDDENTFAHDALHLYRLFPEKIVADDGKVIGRFRQTPKVWWGELIPVAEEK